MDREKEEEEEETKKEKKEKREWEEGKNELRSKRYKIECDRSISYRFPVNKNVEKIFRKLKKKEINREFERRGKERENN